jgi:pyrroloquinoline quinone biosynthesis protein E
LHRQNIHQIGDMLKLAEALKADFVELANSQYYGWALKNIDALLPSRQQLLDAEAITNDFRKRHRGNMDVIFVVPDYYENRPKACCNGWGTTFLTVTPNGNVQPCQSAQELPGLELPNVREQSLEWAWRESPLFNAFRGTDWMPEPCRSCPEKEQDLGGCRCQAYLLTGDAFATDPVCDLSPKHSIIENAVAKAQNIADLNADGFGYDIDSPPVQPLLFRNPKNAKLLSKK